MAVRRNQKAELFCFILFSKTWAIEVFKCFITRRQARVIWKSPGKSHIGRRRRQLLQLSSSLSGVIGVCPPRPIGSHDLITWPGLHQSQPGCVLPGKPGRRRPTVPGPGIHQTLPCWGHTRLTWLWWVNPSYNNLPGSEETDVKSCCDKRSDQQLLRSNCWSVSCVLSHVSHYQNQIRTLKKLLYYSIKPF